MFIDAPYLSIAAAQRHRDLIAEADIFRLGALAKAARRAARAAQRPVEPRPVESQRPPEGGPPEGVLAGQSPAAAESDADRRCAVSR